MGRHLLAVSVVLSSLGACVAAEPDSSGTIELHLVGQAPSGAVYRLRDATIVVQGPNTTTFWMTEDDPSRTSLSANVVVGSYSATLQPGWRLERVDGMSTTTVQAVLTSPNPMQFMVNVAQRAVVPLQFRAFGEDVDMSQGYDIIIGVQECTAQGEMACSDGIDNDCDGAIDCGDVDCVGTPACPAGPAVVRINEVNANIFGGCDLIELRVVTGGNLSGFRIVERLGPPGDLSLVFPSMVVQPDDFIVVHLNSAICNPNGAVQETASKTEQPAAAFAGNFDTAYDFWSPDSGLITTDNVLTLFDAGNAVTDAVFLSNDPAAPSAASQTEIASGTVGAAGQWQPALPIYLDAVFRMNAVDDLDATGTTAAGTSIQRLDNTDDNNVADWTAGAGAASTWGALNAGQTPF